MYPRFKPKITDIKEVSENGIYANHENGQEAPCTDKISRSTLVEAIQALPNPSSSFMKHLQQLDVKKYEETNGNTIKKILEIINWKLGREVVSSNDFEPSCESLDIIHELINSSQETPHKTPERTSTKNHGVSTQVDNDLISQNLLEDSLKYLRNARI